MPIRQMKESSEQHMVIKPQLQNSMNFVQKSHKTAQNGKGPPSQDPQNNKFQNQPSGPSPPSKNRGRRRGRGGRKSDQGDVFMRPASRPCTVVNKPVPAPEVSAAIVPCTPNVSVVNGANSCDMEIGFPSSSKALSFAPRPGFGQLGTRCIVKANHFFAELPDKDLHHYDVSSASLMAFLSVLQNRLYSNWGL